MVKIKMDGVSSKYQIAKSLYIGAQIKSSIIVH